MFILASSPADTTSGSSAKSTSSVPCSVASILALTWAYAGVPAASEIASSAGSTSENFTALRRPAVY